jgi:predicted RNA binding protein YcfA (HicA-like mRNA interferase family)
MPSIDGATAVKAFERLGFVEVRTTGSHVILKKDGHRYILAVPVHGHKDVKNGTLKGLVKASGCTLEEFHSVL